MPPSVAHAALGFDYSSLLQQLGISPELLDEPRARIAPEQFTRLIQGLWLALDDEYLGFGQRSPSKPGSFRHDVPRLDSLPQSGESPATRLIVL